MLAAAGQGLRSAARGDQLMTRVAAATAAIAAMRLAFTLARRYAPCSKWLPRAFAELRGEQDPLVLEVAAMSTWNAPAQFPPRLLALTRRLIEELNAAQVCEAVPLEIAQEWPFGPFSRLAHSAMVALEATLRPPLTGSMHSWLLDLWPLTGSGVTPAAAAAVAATAG
jgi:hypothetical protein